MISQLLGLSEWIDFLVDLGLIDSDGQSRRDASQVARHQHTSSEMTRLVVHMARAILYDALAQAFVRTRMRTIEEVMRTVTKQARLLP